MTAIGGNVPIRLIYGNKIFEVLRMVDLFAKKFDTLENRLAKMPPEAALAVVQETQRRLQRTTGYRWAHEFLGDITKQLKSGFVPRLTVKQIRHVLIYAKRTGVDIPHPSHIKEKENGEVIRQSC